MNITLLPIGASELQALANARTPDTVGRRALEGALPPDFVARRALEHMTDGTPAGWCSTYYVVRNRDQAVVGSCGFKGPPKNGSVEIGYGVAPDSRNEGIATEAVRALLGLAFESGQVQAVLAQVSPANLSSTRVVLKLAFKRAGEQVDHDNELLVQWVAAALTRR